MNSPPPDASPVVQEVREEPVETEVSEADELRQMLASERERLRSWKERTKAAVEKERAQLIQLSNENNELAAAKEALERDVDKERSLASALRQQLGEMSGAAITREKVFKNDIMRLCTFFQNCVDAAVDAACRKNDILMSCAVADMQTAVRASSTEAQQAVTNLSNYRLKAERALKLASHDQQTIRDELAGAKKALAEAGGELQRLKQEISYRDSMVRDISTQLDSARAALMQRDARISELLDDDRIVRVVEDKLREAEAVQAAREREIKEGHEQHVRDLITAHEAEMAEARTEFEKEISAALNTRNSSGSSSGIQQRQGAREPSQGRASLHREETNKAYDELIKENSALSERIESERTRARGLTQEVLQLKRQVEILRQRTDATTASRWQPLDSGLTVQTSGVPGMGASHGQVSTRGHAASSSAVQAGSLGSHPEKSSGALFGGAPFGGGGDALQKREYLRSVLLKMLCAENDEIRASLVPVIATLSGFDKSDLETIYATHPSWRRGGRGGSCAHQ